MLLCLPIKYYCYGGVTTTATDSRSFFGRLATTEGSMRLPRRLSRYSTLEPVMRDDKVTET